MVLPNTTTDHGETNDEVSLQRLSSSEIHSTPVVQKECCHSSTHPPNAHAGTSLHVMCYTRLSPTLVLQATNTGERRPRYEASNLARLGHKLSRILESERVYTCSQLTVASDFQVLTLFC